MMECLVYGTPSLLYHIYIQSLITAYKCDYIELILYPPFIWRYNKKSITLQPK